MKSKQFGFWGAVLITLFGCMGGLITSAHGMTFVPKCALSAPSRWQQACDTFHCVCDKTFVGSPCTQTFPGVCLQNSSCTCNYITQGVCQSHNHGVFATDYYCDGRFLPLNCQAGT
jgi:hypothetical protein